MSEKEVVAERNCCVLTLTCTNHHLAEGTE